VVPNKDAGEWISEGASSEAMWCSRPEELGRARDRLEALRQGTQNLVDSYTEMVPKALEVLPSETRHRI
jgi:hypothetical protein